MISFKDFLIEGKGLHVFDVDGVAFHPNAHVHVNDEHGKRVESLDHHAFNTHKLKDGHSYDFSEFRDADTFAKGKPIHPILRKIKAIQKNGGKVAFNTARSDFNDKDKVLDKFSRHGVNMDKAHLHRAGNNTDKISTAEKKNVVLRKMITKHQPSHIHFYDDDKANLDAFNKEAANHPGITFHAWHVQHDGTTKGYKMKTLKALKESAENYSKAYDLGKSHGLNGEKKQSPWPKEYPYDLLHKAYHTGYKDWKQKK